MTIEKDIIYRDYRHGYGKHKGRVRILHSEELGLHAEVSIGKRKITKMSVSDLNILNQHSFRASQRSDGQYCAKSSQTKQYLHRLLMEVDDPLQEVDHINHNPLDNRRGNLRPCSRRQNSLAKRQVEQDGFYGIHQSPVGWRAVKPKGGLTRVFATKELAARERDELMWEEYFHAESEHEVFHNFNFIGWNTVSPAIEQLAADYQRWIEAQYDDAQDAGWDIVQML